MCNPEIPISSLIIHNNTQTISTEINLSILYQVWHAKVRNEKSCAYKSLYIAQWSHVNLSRHVMLPHFRNVSFHLDVGGANIISMHGPSIDNDINTIW